MKSLVLIVSLLSSTAVYAEYQLAQEIISKDLTISNSAQFNQRLQSFLAQAKDVVRTSVNPKNKIEAGRLYTRLSTFLEVYQEHYEIPKKLKLEVEDLLHDLSLKFSLQSQNPWIVPITDVTVSVEKEGSIKVIFPFALADKGRPLTQTEAYISRKVLQKAIEQSFTTYIESYPYKNHNYNNLIEKVIEQERTMRDYYVFYHGQANYFILFYDILKEVIGRLANTSTEIAFDYLRVPGFEEFNQKLSEVLKKSFENDALREISNILLPVNLCLFGSSTNWQYESTFFYFIQSSSISPPDNLWASLFKKFNLNYADYAEEIAVLLSYIKPREGSLEALKEEGNLLQIFIPKDKINDYVLLTKAYAQPLQNPNHKWDSMVYSLLPIVIKDKQGITHTYNPRTIDAATYLEIYRNNPDAIDPRDMDLIQARILLTNDFLLNPNSGVKIYRYNTIAPENMRMYKQKLKELVDRMLTGTNKSKSHKRAASVK